MNQTDVKSTLRASTAGLVIFLVAFVARALWVMTMKNNLYWSDEHAFWEIGRRLANGEGYVSESYRANPVLPVYLSLIFRIFGESLLAARLGQCVLGALTCVLIYGVGTRLFNRTTGILSGAALAVYPLHIYLAGVFYAEALLIFWGAVAVYMVCRALQPGAGMGWALATGVALGIVTLTRSTLIVWIPCVALVGFWQARTRFAWCAALLAGSAVVIVPWTIRNYRVFHAFVPVNSGAGTILWQANNPVSTGFDRADWELFPNSTLWNERLANLPAVQRRALETQYQQVEQRINELSATMYDRSLAYDKVLGPLATHYMVTHPLQTLVRCGRRLRLLFSAFSPTASTNEHTAGRYKLIAAVAFYPLLALAVAGMALGLTRFRKVALLYLLIGSVALATSLMLGTQTRYRLPLDPYLILFASFAVSRILQKWAPQWFDIAQGSG